MKSVGMRELARNTRRIVEEVSASREPVAITVRGRVLAQLVAPPKRATPEEIRRALEGLREIRQRVTEAATTETNSSTLMAEERE